MKVFLVDNAYLIKDLSGSYYSAGIYNNTFFERYLKVFEKMQFMAKIQLMEDLLEDKQYEKIKTDKLQIIELPAFKGIKGLIKNLHVIIRTVKKATKDCDCLILRMLQLEGILCWIYRYKRPYIVEVVNNPMTEKRFSGIVKKVLIKVHSIIINKANGASYVTDKTLQRFFPYRGKGFQACYSSVELPDKLIMEPKKYEKPLEEIKMVHVCNAILENSKGHYTILNIIKGIIERGKRASCYFYGDGPSILDIKKTADKLGIGRQIHFMGYVSKKEILLEELRRYDLFIFPSESEGMPRCVIEACSAGLPCLASNVGGIPEIISEKYLIEYENANGYCEKILDIMNSPEELSYMSETNVSTAKRFKKSTLDEKRTKFYLQFANSIL